MRRKFYKDDLYKGCRREKGTYEVVVVAIPTTSKGEENMSLYGGLVDK